MLQNRSRRYTCLTSVTGCGAQCHRPFVAEALHTNKNTRTISALFSRTKGPSLAAHKSEASFMAKPFTRARNAATVWTMLALEGTRCQAVVEG